VLPPTGNPNILSSDRKPPNALHMCCGRGGGASAAAQQAPSKGHARAAHKPVADGHHVLVRRPVRLYPAHQRARSSFHQGCSPGLLARDRTQLHAVPRPPPEPVDGSRRNARRRCSQPRCACPSSRASAAARESICSSPKLQARRCPVKGLPGAGS